VRKFSTVRFDEEGDLAYLVGIRYVDDVRIGWELSHLLQEVSLPSEEDVYNSIPDLEGNCDQPQRCEKLLNHKIVEQDRICPIC
jgi:hypothetical protein